MVSLALTIPTGLQPDDEDDVSGFSIGDLDVSPRGGTKILSTTDDPEVDGNGRLTITFDEISMGQKVIITYTRSTPITISGCP